MLRTLLLVILLLTASAARPGPLLAYEFGDEPDLPRIHPVRVRIGDLVLDIPPNQKFRAELETPASGPIGNPDSRWRDVTRVTELAFIGPDAWRMAGAHPHATGYEPTALLIRLTLRKDAPRFDFWCNNKIAASKPGRLIDLTTADRKDDQFYIFGEAGSPSLGYRIPLSPITLLNSPMLFMTGELRETKNIFGFDYELLYDTNIALTKNISLYLRFSNNDLVGASFKEIVGNLQTTISAWIVDTSVFEKNLFHQKNRVCGSSSE